MQKYFYANRFQVINYFIFSILTYSLMTIMFYSYSWITEATESMNLSEAYSISFICAMILLGLLVFLNITAIIKRRILYFVSKHLRKDIFDKSFKIKMSTFSAKKTSYYSSMLLNDVETLETNYFAMVIELAGDCVQLIIMYIFIFTIGYEYLVIVMLLSIPSLIQPFLLKKQLGKYGLKVSGAFENYTNKIKEYVFSFELVKTFCKVDLVNKMFFNDVKQLERTRNNEKTLKAINACLMMTAIYFIKVGSQLFFTYTAINGVVTVATVTLLFGIANNVGNPLSSILGYISAINSTKEVRNKLTTFLSTKEDNVSANNRTMMKSFDKNIVVKNVSFSYGDKSVLNSISVEFEKGKKYALLGESGSGKSTLLKLLMGYYSDYNGTIEIDGTNQKEIECKNIWDNIAYIHQNVFIMEGTLKDNITLFDDSYDERQIIEAVKIAGLEELVASLPKGVNSDLTEGGKNFSGGEKQRISIARAVLADREIILVDEGLSALDNIVATNVENMLLGLNKTIISIQHRLNKTISKYDTILIFENGSIAEKGSYDQLIKKNGLFCKMRNEKVSGDNEK